MTLSKSFNPDLHKLRFEVVEDQIRGNNPPETKATWDRFIKTTDYTNLQKKRRSAVWL